MDATLQGSGLGVCAIGGALGQSEQLSFTDVVCFILFQHALKLFDPPLECTGCAAFPKRTFRPVRL